MKKYILFFILFAFLCLFLSLEQECFATDNALYVTLGDTNNNFQVDISQAFVDTQYNFSDYVFTNYFSYYNTDNSQYEIYLSTQNFASRYDYPFVYNWGTTFMITYSNDTFHNFGVQPNGDLGIWLQSYTYLTNETWVVRNTEDPFTYSTLYVDSNYLTQSSGSGGEEEEEEDSGLLQGIKDFFLGIFIPDEDAFQDLQDNFTEKILSKFNIINISRGNVSYNNNDIYESSFRDELPVFNIYGYKFKGQMIYDFMHTPLSFGNLTHMRDNYTEWIQPVSTSGITLFDIINLIFGIGITTMNIVLFNKFFNKGD